MALGREYRTGQGLSPRPAVSKRARACADASLDGNRRNLDALQVQACAGRLSGEASAARAAQEALLALDPLNHFARVERYLQGQGSPEDVTGLIRNELPQETYLELAVWYHGVARDADAARVLDLAPPTAEVLYWLAYLRQDAALCARAEAATPAFVFPFRIESVPVFEWACAQGHAWQPKYFLALLRWHLGEPSQARELLSSCGDEPRFSPFYAVRAQLNEASAEADLKRAAALDPGQWRYGAMLTRHFLQREEFDAAVKTAAAAAQRFPGQTALAILLAKAQVAAGKYADAAQRLDTLKLLPSEGATDARSLFHEAHLMLAVARLKARDFDAALSHLDAARQWPERLGSGKPYPEDIDERLEDWLTGQCHLGRQAPEEATKAIDRLLSFAPHARPEGIGAIVRILALKHAGQANEAEAELRNWRERDPSNSLASWAADLLAGRASPPPAALSRSADGRALAAWLR